MSERLKESVLKTEVLIGIPEDFVSLSLSSAPLDVVKAMLRNVLASSSKEDLKNLMKDAQEEMMYECDEEKHILLNHCILIVGYIHLKGKTYWIIQNSHGVEWGANGYEFIPLDDILSDLLPHILASNAEDLTPYPGRGVLRPDALQNEVHLMGSVAKDYDPVEKKPRVVYTDSDEEILNLKRQRSGGASSSKSKASAARSSRKSKDVSSKSVGRSEDETSSNSKDQTPKSGGGKSANVAVKGSASQKHRYQDIQDL
ncbi:hypothetical protein FNV43_RR10491 [Rhamnella rubrinervis]|uniref:Peptidase C1A papain C-terminal domain-containing protein n=1 Tax=Rhamnella rubrinervis TaxID=2594499 RepID=A0A8K0H413_9ROSA|nr:hypothetical protein FNV43_RR10491 [Rhamnella rubrinervis]